MVKRPEVRLLCFRTGWPSTFSAMIDAVEAVEQVRKVLFGHSSAVVAEFEIIEAVVLAGEEELAESAFGI